MKTLSLEQMEKVEGGKFWGLGDCSPIEGTQVIIEHNGGAYDCQQQWLCTVYRLWIPFGQKRITGGCDYNF